MYILKLIEAANKQEHRAVLTFIQKCSQKKSTFSSFVEDLSEAEVERKELNIIEQTICNINCANFYCVLSDDKYYQENEDDPNKLSAQTKELISYFLIPTKNRTNNTIFRVFSEASNCDSNTIILQNKSRSKILFQYLCINYVSSVKTYLLLYDKVAFDRNDINTIELRDLLPNADYVLSIGGFSSSSNSLLPNALYLTCTQQNNDNSNSNFVLKTSDEIFIKLAINDFYNRLSILDRTVPSPYYQCVEMDDTTNKLVIILKHLNLRAQEAIESIQCLLNYFNSENKNAIKDTNIEKNLNFIIQRLKKIKP